MTDQGSLFTITYDQEPETPQAPTCPSCRLRPARWNPKRHQYARYCGGAHCDNHQRACHECKQTYRRDTPGAGTKYCSEECKIKGYNPAQRQYLTPVPCANCGHEYKPSRKLRAQICRNCRLRYAGQIQTHNLSTEWAKRLIQATTCEACGERLASANAKHLGQVDHDHNCCPGYSCGECVRGIICTRCNTLAATIESEPARYQAVQEYLTRSQP